MISATIINMAGKRLEQEFKTGSSVLDMKQLLSVEWGVPPSFQIILRDSIVTRDSDQISGDAVYSFVTSVENGCKTLPSLVDNANEEVKVQALKYLAKSGVDNALVITTAESFLGDANIQTRAEAMHTIAAVAEAGDQYAIRLLASSIDDQHDLDFDTVMMASIQGLAKIGRGNASAIAALQSVATVTAFHVLGGDIAEATRDAAIQVLENMGVELEDPGAEDTEDEEEEEEDMGPAGLF
eukprot:gnl/MRDRNA2_/MRDRNA2_102895_c0_seq1.p1 gnl/MRDRNA2_/MRDRNA2_102895_c0~~gnl/MRDRNA2_/MRDRNA2_102895_c0_seq1.p1  ORF type:complete len:240 (-),score=61.60 gnl/MRDRNA2_/MRDRNA2_102895_c0_seq1:203-922(-)